MKTSNKKVTFKPSHVHQGHYVYINGYSTGKVVNMFAYQTVDDYRKNVDKEIEELCKN